MGHGGEDLPDDDPEIQSEKTAKTKYTQIEVRERIANIITAPNAAWAKRKKTEPYSIPRNYFGQYA